ncbi:PREDICTED: transcription factor TFIIIB component B'' isoform X2 [Ipomoea nil]|uniref:transcription factor TFIIIB component B'' isoform X2 n=1 Tax=Ipomoea nil TaxID=35883 RepID=UPI0009009715|nr:PREDICTED: transcription factor TFIIIB component B'' isoform X2 [Ipomoea nil]
MDSLDDLFSDGAAKTSRAVGKFQPKAKGRPVKKGPVAAATSSAPPSQSNQLGGADKREGTEVLKAGQLSTKDGSSELIVPENNRDLQCCLEKSVGESADLFPELESLDDFLPHDTNATETTIPSSEEQLAITTTSPVDDPTPVSNIPGAQNSEVSAAQGPLTCGEPVVATHEGVSQIDSIDLEIEGIETYPCLETPDGPELATISGRHTGKFQPKPKAHVFKESCDTGIPNSCAQESLSTDFVDKERLPALSDDVLDLSSLGFDHAPPTESTPEVPVNEEMPNVDVNFPAEQPGSSGINADENIDAEFQVENETQKKKGRKKAKKKAGGEEKPARKRKKADKTEQATKEKPKKFSHTTRQKRRMVDKALLDTPEDEIDFQRVRIKDLILLAEHKERLAKKEAALQNPQPQVNPSNVDNSSELNNEEERFTFDEDENENGEAFEEQTTNEVEDSTVYFNYQTYMEKTPRVRWSKEDTEVFYEAIRQFGSDFSMIQQLFPGRTRAQIRLKYKKEERRHPSRVHDALTNRSKDHSRFEQVIAHLRQIAAEEVQNDDGIDESIDLTGEEGQKEEPNSEHNEEAEVQDVEQDVTQVNSSVVEEDEEDEDIWSQYKSEF